jgi:hypothetical protein
MKKDVTDFLLKQVVHTNQMILDLTRGGMAIMTQNRTQRPKNADCPYKVGSNYADEWLLGFGD